MDKKYLSGFMLPGRWILLLTFLLPQTLLLVTNLRGWQIIHAETDDQQRSWALIFLLFEVSLLLSTSVLFGWLHKIRIRWPLLLPSLIAHSGYMLLFLYHLDDIIPSTIQPWIISAAGLGQWNISLMMPAAFISLLMLSRQFLTGKKPVTVGVTITAAIVATPLLWYLAMTIAEPLFMGRYSEAALVTLSVLLVTVFLGVLSFVFDRLLFQQVEKEGLAWHLLITVILALMAPLAGLMLNREIQFPANFQTFGVYAMTLLNALILSCPPGGQRLAGWRLFARGLAAPFTAYFFWLFLPYLPLSFLAIFAAGAGFLMLTPLVLGLFQARVSWHDWLVARQQFGFAKALTVFLAGMLLLPAAVVMESLRDQQALQISLDYFYAHDNQGPALTDQQMKRAANALVRVRNQKVGVHLPLISGVYQSIVLDNLMLPDVRINAMYHWLTNQDMPSAPENLLGGIRRAWNDWGDWPTTPPSEDVSLLSTQLSHKTDGEEELHLLLQNHSDSTHSQYVGSITLPEGVFITGMRLKIDDQWVAANIFDRKTALWVFNKITEFRQDPALLFYKTPHQLELKVYPFPGQGTRELALDVMYLPGSHNQISIDGRNIQLPGKNDAAIVTADGRYLTRSRLQQYRILRQPYLHFIVDTSAGTEADTQAIAEQIQSVRQQLGIAAFRISTANIEVIQPSDDNLLTTTDSDEIAGLIRQLSLSKRGGLWQQLALESTLQHDIDTLKASTAGWRPVPVLLTGKPIDQSVDLSVIHARIPDMIRWYQFDGTTLLPHNITDTSAHVPVWVLTSEHQWWIAAADSNLLIPASVKTVQFWQPVDEQLQPVTVNSQTRADSPWSSSAQLWLRWSHAINNPALLETERLILLQDSRRLGVLIPTTAWITTERASQTEMLKRKEQQSLDNHSALTFDEQKTPEPAGWMLLLALLVYLWYRDYRFRLNR